LRYAPLGFDPTFPLEAVKRLIERGVLDGEGAVGPLADPLRDAVAVHRRPRQGLENQHIDGPLHETERFTGHAFPSRTEYSPCEGTCASALRGARSPRDPYNLAPRSLRQLFRPSRSWVAHPSAGDDLRPFTLPHPLVLLVIGVVVAAAFTWIVPAGEYERTVDEATGRTVAVAGTYRQVPKQPVGPFDVAVAIPRGFVEGADVIATILFVGAAFFLVDRVGTLGRLLAALIRRLGGRGLVAIPIVALFFGVMGALEN